VPDDPVTDTGRVLDVSKVVDTAAVTAAPTVGAKPAPTAKPTITTLILYDLGDADITAAAPVLKSGYYPGGALQGVQTWKEMTAALAKYSTINTLVMFFHSAGGQLIFEGENPTAQFINQQLAASGAKVTGAIRFEGCNIMLAPVTTAYLVAGIAGPSATVSGYTFYSLYNHVTVSGLPRDQAQALLDSYAGFWVPGTPTADSIAAAKSQLTLWQRWFRSGYDKAPIPPRTPGADPPRGFVPVSKLEQRGAKSADEALKLEKELEAPVNPAALVTVHNITGVAAKHSP